MIYEVYNLITSAKTLLFQIRSYSQVLRIRCGHMFWWVHHLTHYTILVVSYTIFWGPSQGVKSCISEQGSQVSKLSLIHIYFRPP